jgi:hypothetical protein
MPSNVSMPSSPPTVSHGTRRLLKKKEEHQNKDHKTLKSQRDDGPKQRNSKTGGRSGSDNYNYNYNYDDSCSSSTNMDESFSHSPSSFSKSPSRRMVKKEYQNKDPNSHPLNTQTVDKPKKLRPLFLRQTRFKVGGRSRSGNDDNNNDSCASLSVEEFVTHDKQQSSLSSLGSSLRKSFRSFLETDDDDESSNDLQQVDDDDNDIDQDKLIAILCKELEITCDEDDC